jgi:hypothetical protein
VLLSKGVLAALLTRLRAGKVPISGDLAMVCAIGARSAVGGAELLLAIGRVTVEAVGELLAARFVVVALKD